MRVKHLRARVAVSLLKAEMAWTTDDEGPIPHTLINMIPCGHFIVSRHGKHILLTGAMVEYAELYEPTMQPPKPAKLKE